MRVSLWVLFFFFFYMIFSSSQLCVAVMEGGTFGSSFFVPYLSISLLTQRKRRNEIGVCEGFTPLIQNRAIFLLGRVKLGDCLFVC